MLSWEIKKKSDHLLIVFTGEVDERSNFSELTNLTGTVTLDLAGIQRINSEGVRLWINFIRSLTGVEELAFIRCSVAMVTQLNMIYGFQGHAEVRSFYAPYFCTKTGQEEERLLTHADVPDPLSPPTFPCEGGELALDDTPERYFAFLLEEQK